MPKRWPHIYWGTFTTNILCMILIYNWKINIPNIQRHAQQLPDGLPNKSIHLHSKINIDCSCGINRKADIQNLVHLVLQDEHKTFPLPLQALQFVKSSLDERMRFSKNPTALLFTTPRPLQTLHGSFFTPPHTRQRPSCLRVGMSKFDWGSSRWDMCRMHSGWITNGKETSRGGLPSLLLFSSLGPRQD